MLFLHLISVSSKSSLKLFIRGDKVEIPLSYVFGVGARQLKLPRDRKEGVIRGIELHTFSSKENNRLKHRVIYLSHPSENLNLKWQTEINGLLKGMNNKNNLVLVYLLIYMSNSKSVICNLYSYTGMLCFMLEFRSGLLEFFILFQILEVD